LRYISLISIIPPNNESNNKSNTKSDIYNRSMALLLLVIYRQSPPQYTHTYTFNNVVNRDIFAYFRWPIFTMNSFISCLRLWNKIYVVFI